METEVQLLDLLIKAEAGSKTAFAEKLGLSRQVINYHIREAKENDGKFSIGFKETLKAHGFDLYRFKRNPTNDFYQNKYQTEQQPMIAAEPETPIMNSQQRIIELLEREIELMKRLNEVEKERDELKSQIPLKKEGRRRSA